ncbi:MAG: hypothetical protein LBM87_04055 [Ruminococcus sp.]|jgi:hypothetical protein|nr:hypothetical protein [Ruminococcus sp.]
MTYYDIDLSKPLDKTDPYKVINPYMVYDFIKSLNLNDELHEENIKRLLLVKRSEKLYYPSCAATYVMVLIDNGVKFVTKSEISEIFNMTEDEIDTKIKLKYDNMFYFIKYYENCYDEYHFKDGFITKDSKGRMKTVFPCSELEYEYGLYVQKHTPNHKKLYI